MSKVVISEYVNHLFEKHQHTGNIHPALEKLRDKLAREVGECASEYYDETLKATLPGFPLDDSKMDTWRELVYVKGFLATNAAKGADCVACLKNVKR